MRIDSIKLAVGGRGLLATAAVLVMSGFFVSQVVSQDAKQPRTPTGAKAPDGQAEPGQNQMAEMMKKWEAVASPGKHHRLLDHSVGSWDVAIKTWMGGPQAPAMESTGRAEARWILDGRYVEEVVQSKMSMPDGQGGMTEVSFEGKGLTGYDNYKNIYVGVWVDNMGTQMVTLKGTSVPGSNVLTMYGEMDEPMMDMQDRLIKCVTRIVDKNKHVFEMYDLAVGDHHKVMEITYTRR